MVKNPKIVAAIIIVAVSIGIVLGIKFFALSSRGSLLLGTSARAKGNQKAPIQITEFIDFQCPSCAKGSKYLRKFMLENPGAVYLKLKYYPLRNHAHGLQSARYTECAFRQGKFWPFHDYLIDRQDNWRRLSDATPAFDLIAKEVGLEPSVLGQCLKDESTTDYIMKDKKEGDILGVQSTPTYYINGTMVVGTQSLEQELKKRLEEIKN